jgi:valyl-tRNA synthetase
MDISPGKPLPVILQGASESDLRRVESQSLLLQRVGRVESVEALAEGSEPPASATALLGDMRLLVPMKGLIDVEAERARLMKQHVRINLELKKSVSKLSNEKFVNNAPPEVVTQERERIQEFERTIVQLNEQLEKLNELT